MNSASTTSPRLPATLARILDHIRRRHLAMSLARFPIYLFPTIAIAWTLQAIADRVFELSWGARCTLLILDILVVLALFAWFVIRPLQQRLDRKAAALLAERGIPEFRSSLISSLELTAPDAGTVPQSRPLVDQLLKQTTHLAKKLHVIPRILPAAPLQKFALRMTLPVIAAIALLILGFPTSNLLLSRILLSHESFPARTAVTSITGELRVDEGTDTTVSARAVGDIPATGKLIITRANSAPEILTVPPVQAGSDEFSLVVRNIREPFTYHFELNDGTGPTHQLTVHHPPAIKEIHFTQNYPAYTGLPDSEMPPTALKLLQGSTLRIAGTATVPLTTATLQITSDPAVPPTRLYLSNSENTSFTTNLTVPASGWKSLSIPLTGLESDPSRNDLDYPIQIERDRPPSINLTSPKDEITSVLANTSVPVSFDLSDDFGFTDVKLFYQIFRPLPDGTTKQAETANIPFKAPDHARLWKRSFDWKLARIIPTIPIGGSIVFWIEATDNNPSPANTAIRSPEKIILIVSEEQKRLELLKKMGERAAEIENLYLQQRAINGRIESAIK